MSWGPVRPRTRAEIRELDRRAIQDFGIPGLILMENAGRATAEVAMTLASPSSGPVAILCGRGNNGGDGFVVARHLFNHGYSVEAWYTDDPDAALPAHDAGLNLVVARTMGIPILRWSESLADRLTGTLGRAGLVVDALLGTGATGVIRAPYDRLISLSACTKGPILAIDVPSGLDADTGVPGVPCVRATATVTFAAPKVGFEKAREWTGQVHLIEISIPRCLYPELGLAQMR